MDWPAKPAQRTSAVLKFLNEAQRLNNLNVSYPRRGDRTEAASPLSKLEFRALDVADPHIHGTAHWILDRLMRIIETALAPDGKSTGGLHGLTIDMAAWAHTDGTPSG